MTGAPPPDPPDDVLVAAAREGSVRAFETLLDRHQSQVLRVLRLMGVPAGDREDVAQEIFIRVFRHLDGFKPGRPFGGWIYRVTVNASYDYRLRTGRRDRQEAEWAGDAALGPPEAVLDREGDARRLRGRLLLAMGRLTDRERAVFVLKEVEGLESVEIARILGITRVTVRRHLERARDRLKGLLGGD